MANKEVVEWFKSQLDEGFTKTQLISTLRGSGYTQEYIDEIIHEVEGKKEQPKAGPSLWEPVKWKGKKKQPRPQPTAKPKQQKPNLAQMAEKKQKKKLPIKLIISVLGLLFVIIIGIVGILFVLPMLQPEPTSNCLPLSNNGKKTITESTVLCEGEYSGASLNIGSDDITLDCNNSILKSRGSQLTYREGIIVKDRSNVKIQNCVLSGYTSGEDYPASGIHVENSENIIITKNKFQDNKYSIFMEGSSKNTIEENQLTGGDKGIALTNSKQNKIKDNAGTVDNIGIRLELGSNNNLLTGNKFNSGQKGIIIQSSTYNVLTNNEFCNNSVEDAFCEQVHFGSGNKFGSARCDTVGSVPC